MWEQRLRVKEKNFMVEILKKELLELAELESSWCELELSFKLEVSDSAVPLGGGLPGVTGSWGFLWGGGNEMELDGDQDCKTYISIFLFVLALPQGLQKDISSPTRDRT